MRALDVDKELSPLVRRSFTLAPDPVASSSAPVGHEDEGPTVVELRTLYEAATNRLLRVAVNGFMESIVVVLGVMLDLDVDVLEKTDG